MSELNKNQLEQLAIEFNSSLKEDTDFLYECYKDLNEAIDALSKSNLPTSNLISDVKCIDYLFGEYLYYKENNDEEYIKSFKVDDNFKARLISNALDKYLTNEHLAYKTNALVNKYHPMISSLSLYLNFVLGMLFRHEKNNPSKTLNVDLLNKAFLLSKSILNLLNDGFETVAFSTWRTLHETECIITLISKYKDKIIKPYLKHMDYSAAFRGLYSDKEKVDAIFVELKKEMKELDLKSKDMKRYIEYGYITNLDEYKTMDLKLNFRDGVEKLAGLSMYSQTYEMSSEIAHSSPIMIYSRKEYFFYLTLINVYEAFFRMEKYFYEEYKTFISEQELHTYEIMRKNYLTQLGSIYNIELEKFKKLNSK